MLSRVKYPEQEWMLQETKLLSNYTEEFGIFLIIGAIPITFGLALWELGNKVYNVGMCKKLWKGSPMN